MAKRNLKHSILLSALLLGQPWLSIVQAQDNQPVTFDIQVIQNLPDFTEREESQVSYDIIDLASNTVVYSYRNGESQPTDLVLTPGDYRLRFYYWDQLGQAANQVVDEVKQTIAQPTDQDLAQSKTLSIDHLPGQENILGDGSQVYDIDFKVENGQGLVDPATNTYKSQLLIYLADPETARTNDDRPQNQTEGVESSGTDPAAEPAESPTSQDASLLVTVLDPNGTAVPGAVLNFDGQDYQTDQSGQIQLANYSPGTYDIHLVSAPQGLGGQYQDQVVLESGLQQTLSLTLQTIAPETSNLTIRVIDQQGQAVEGATILMQGVEGQSDAQGQVIFEGLVPGDYSYELVGLPDGYTGTYLGQVSIQADGGPYSGEIAVEKAAETGDQLFTVRDQEGQPVVGVGIQFLDRLLATDQNGQVLVRDLNIGTYEYAVTEVPQGYSSDSNPRQFEVELAGQVNETLITLDKVQSAGTLQITVLDQNQAPVAGVGFAIDGVETVLTDAKGQVSIPDLAYGDKTVQLAVLPNGYQGSSDPVTITLDQATLAYPFTVQKDVYQKVTLRLVDQLGQPVADANLTLQDQTGTTDETGQVVFEQVKTGDLAYDITHLPEKFEATYQGNLTVSPGQDLEQTLTLERAIAPAQARLSVKNQEGNPIVGAVVQFGGLTATTDADGQVYFADLQPGNYYYSVVEAPASVHLTGEEVRVEMAEAQDLQAEIVLQEDIVGKAVIKLTDPNGQPLAGIMVTLNQVQLETDQEGQAVFVDLAPGNYAFSLESNGQYRFENSPGQLSVESGQTVQIDVQGQVQETTTLTTTSSTTNSPTTSTITTNQTQSTVTTNQAPTSTETSSQTTSASVTTSQVETSLSQNMKQLIDPTSNVEVWVHPDDQGRVASLRVTRLTTNLPQALATKEADVYQIDLLDANGQVVSPSKTIQVKIPTRLYNGQIQLVRVLDGSFTNIAHTLVNQRANFTTQTLGQFALVYGDKVQAQTETSQVTSTSQAANVQVETSSSREGRLVNTGEGQSLGLRVFAVIAVLSGIGLLFLRRSNKGDRDVK
ncbi:TPA: SpaA isopeptide-forming pilin-related protein [Streptococcus suis]